MQMDGNMCNNKRSQLKIQSLQLAILIMPWISLSQTLPPCQGKDVKKWHNCVGILSFKAGRYEGEFRNGKLSGLGTFTYTHGDRYVGNWQDDKRDGFGIYTQHNGNKYSGHWKDGKPHGHGVSSLSNRSKYVGNHEDGNRHGEGIFYAADGTVEASGMWKDNQLIKSYVLDTTQFPNNQLR